MFLFSSSVGFGLSRFIEARGCPTTTGREILFKSTTICSAHALHSSSCDPEVVLAQRHVRPVVPRLSAEMQVPLKVTGPARSVPSVQQNRAFLDLFWDLSKPDQEVRLKAVENLVSYLKTDTKVRPVHGFMLVQE